MLAAVTAADVTNAGFPFGHVREIAIAGHAVRALRVTYVGELGWELHMPIGATGEIFDALMAAGAPFGIRPVGYRGWNRFGSKGLSRLGLRHHPQRHAVEAAWAGREAAQEHRYPRRRALEKGNGALRQALRRLQRLTTQTSCFSAARPYCATASRFGYSPRGYATRREKASATATCAARTGRATIFLTAATTSCGAPSAPRPAPSGALYDAAG